MAATDNLCSLHKHEEELRARSMTFIEADAALSDHWNLVGEAMNTIFAFSHHHAHGSENELTLQYLGVRLFNAAAASVKLALSGYYQKAFDQVRDVIETYFLVDYLSTYPEKIGEWKHADKKKRISHFGPGFIRNALDKRDGYTSGQRKKIYDLVSELASHASYSGILLMATGAANMVQVGPFFGERKLATWLQEMAMRLNARGCSARVKSRRERHGASDDPQALPGGRRQMVVEVQSVGPSRSCCAQRRCVGSCVVRVQISRQARTQMNTGTTYALTDRTHSGDDVPDHDHEPDHDADDHATKLGAVHRQATNPLPSEPRGP